MSKHFIYLILGALSFATACTSTDTADELLADGVAVKFAARADSRATVTTNTSITAAPFAVYGDMVPTANASTATPTVIFNGTPVTYADGAWSYTNPQYWFPSHTHSFVAIHPASAVGADAQYSNNQLSFTYTQPENYSDGIDILAATHRRNYTYKGSEAISPVAFNFTHILSRVSFVAQVKSSQHNPIVIERLSLKNIKTSATYTIMPAQITGNSNQTDDLNGTSGWSDWAPNSFSTESNEPVVFAPAQERPLVIPAGGQETIFSNSNALFVIPQDIPDEFEVQITYRAQTSTESVTQTAQMLAAVLTHNQEWLPGKRYTYTFSIGVDEDIVFKTPMVYDWDESLGGKYVISD